MARGLETTLEYFRYTLSVLHHSNLIYISGITTFDIQVLGSPSVTVLPDTAKVTEGSDVTFTCSVKAR